jgi:hypothetical protein
MDLGKLGKKKTGTAVVPKINPTINTGKTNGVLGRFIFMDFCQAAKTYLIITLLLLIYYVTTDQDFIWIILKGVVFVAVSFLINALCLKDLKALAWILAIIPPIVFLFFTLKVPPAIPPAPKTTQKTLKN